MAHKVYVGNSSAKASEVFKIYCSPDGKAHRVKKIYVGDSNNKAKLCFESLDLTNVGYYHIYAVPSGTNIYEYLEEGIAADVVYKFVGNAQSTQTDASPICFMYKSPNSLGEITSKYVDMANSSTHPYSADVALPIGTTQIAFLPIYHSPTVSPLFSAPTDSGTIYGDEGNVITTISSGASSSVTLTVGDACTIKSDANEAWLTYGDGTEEMLQFSSGKVSFTVKEELESIEFYSI